VRWAAAAARRSAGSRWRRWSIGARSSAGSRWRARGGRRAARWAAALALVEPGAVLGDRSSTVSGEPYRNRNASHRASSDLGSMVSGEPNRNRNAPRKSPIANPAESAGILFKRLFKRLFERPSDRREWRQRQRSRSAGLSASSDLDSTVSGEPARNRNAPRKITLANPAESAGILFKRLSK